MCVHSVRGWITSGKMHRKLEIVPVAGQKEAGVGRKLKFHSILSCMN